MKFKIGDKVKIVGNLRVLHHYYIGTIGIIKNILPHRDTFVYKICKVDDILCQYVEECDLELLEN